MYNELAIFTIMSIDNLRLELLRSGFDLLDIDSDSFDWEIAYLNNRMMYSVYHQKVASLGYLDRLVSSQVTG